MSTKGTNTDAESSTKKMRLDKGSPSLPVEKANYSKASGFWTENKEVTLLKEYAKYYPPAYKRDCQSKVWAHILECVNSLAPNDPPLSYDMCRRAIDRLVPSYKNYFSKANAASLSGATRCRTDVEEAVCEVIKKKELYDELGDIYGKLDIEHLEERNRAESKMRALAIATMEKRKELQRGQDERRRSEEWRENNDQPVVSPLPADQVSKDQERQSSGIDSRLSNIESRLSNIESRLSNIEKLLEILRYTLKLLVSPTQSTHS
ncbi:hypothetical protein CLU79DRAFT_831988 [Phycomyces nitens]|nr:hypothetical protein CLU79DRAFT_831988 [Phycomyces nitens]